jgi:GT2 family glycosyltransferase
METNTTVSAVMITRNRSAEATAAVNRLLQLPDAPPVIVVDNASFDDTPRSLAAFGDRVRVVALDRNIGAAGRNVGVELASTPYVAFVDDDSGSAPGALDRAAELLRTSPRLAVVAARIMVGDPSRPDPTSLAMAASPLPDDADLPGPPVLGFIACGAVLRRDAFLAAGGFHERYGVGGEELPLAIDLARLGWKLAYVDEVVAHHWPSPIRDRAARRRTLARNELLLAWSRRRWPTAMRLTARSLRLATSNRSVRSGLLDALRHAGVALGDRSPVDPWLEQQLRLIE